MEVLGTPHLQAETRWYWVPMLKKASDGLAYKFPILMPVGKEPHR